jgi:hypothetical protein
MVRAKNGKIRLEHRQFIWEPNVKEEFLSKERETTRKTLKGILLKVDSYEFQTNKSVYDLTLEERDDLIYTQFKNKSIDVVRSNISYISRYINYCIGINLVRHRENRFALLMTDEMDKFVDLQAMQTKYLSKEERLLAQEKLVNPSDKLILQLIPLGIRGRTEEGNTCEELINLRVVDVEESSVSKELNVINNDGEGRTILIDNRTIELLKETINTKIYVLNNGKDVSRKKQDKLLKRSGRVLPIEETDWVFRTAGKNKGEKVKPQFFNTRIRMIRDWIENPYMTVTNLYFSGMIDMAEKIMEEKGKLEIEDYIKIKDYFDYGKPIINAKGEEEWNPVIYRLKSKVDQYFKYKEGGKT